MKRRSETNEERKKRAEGVEKRHEELGVLREKFEFMRAYEKAK